ncbi:MAG: hypothetical protein N3F05_03840 [Candidatus Diapherotrites archaeon]|nr:hypothetical protein [Candidatus Diapherotrites archaeon]
MEIEIKEDISNPVVGREEIIFEIKGALVFKRDEVKKRIAQLKNTNESNIVIRYIKRRFGERRCFGEAHLYKNSDLLKRFEPKHILSRGTEKTDQKGKKVVDEKNAK